MRYSEEEEKVEDVEKTKLLIHDVVNNKMFEVDRPIDFEKLDDA
ncbi:hypothetical protein [Candidatus Borrarchaeum sp.]|nr:hypothetical protein [Candidatus Borrarchaeum sp.]